MAESISMSNHMRLMATCLYIIFDCHWIRNIFCLMIFAEKQPISNVIRQSRVASGGHKISINNIMFTWFLYESKFDPIYKDWQVMMFYVQFTDYLLFSWILQMLLFSVKIYVFVWEAEKHSNKVKSSIIPLKSFWIGNYTFNTKAFQHLLVQYDKLNTNHL